MATKSRARGAREAAAILPRARRATPSIESGGLANQADHHTEDFQRSFGADDRVGLVLRSKNEASALHVEALQSELAIHDRDDDLAAPRRRALFYHREIAVQNPRVLH